jgi:eukaryotic-like serine/threonine-protein kinase
LAGTGITGDEWPQRVARALLPGYTVQAVVGRGGAASVFAARDEMLGRTVAIKVLSPNSDPLEAERFRREARLMAQLRHPHIVPVYQVARTDGLAWFVMPLVEGENLRALLMREGRLPIDESVRILREIAAGLHVAHQAGIVHRDIKPENVLLEGNGRHVLVTDFGIARAERAGDSRLTVRDAVVGTPHYMSPEQATGEGETGPASDIYSFGVVGYELLTGRLPFEAATVPGVLLQHASQEAPRVEWARPDCPAALADLIARCLAKHPGDRWASIAEVERALATVRLEPPAIAGRIAARWMPLIFRGAPRRSLVGRFRALAGLFLLLNTVVFLVDLRDGALDFAPLLLLVLGFMLASQYGDLRHAGFTWRDLLHRRRSSAEGGTDPMAPGEKPTPDA